jgi:hypothetical protein
LVLRESKEWRSLGEPEADEGHEVEPSQDREASLVIE